MGALYCLLALAAAVLVYLAITSVGIKADPLSDFVLLARAVLVVASVGGALWVAWLVASIMRRRPMHLVWCGVAGMGAWALMAASVHFAVTDLSNTLVAQAGALTSLARSIAEAELPPILKDWLERLLESVR